MSLQQGVSSGNNSSNRWIWIFLILTLVMAFALRFYHLDFLSLWLDEIYTMRMADPANSWADIYRLSFVNDPLSVLYFILLNGFFKIAGYTAFAARLFSLLFGVASVYLIYDVGRQLRGREFGLLAAVLLAIMPFHIQYSQEARVYTMYMFFTLLSFKQLYQFLQAPTIKASVFYGLATLLMLLSHFFGFFVLSSQCLIMLIWVVRKKIPIGILLRRMGLAAAIVVVGYSPIIPIFLFLTRAEGTWISPPHLDELLRLYREFQGNSTELAWTGAILMAIFIVFAFRKTASAGNQFSDRELLLFLSVWILISFLIPFVISLIRFPIFHPRYMISYLPPFVLLAAAGLQSLPVGRWRYLGLVPVFFFTVPLMFGSGGYYNMVRKSDFRGVSDFIKANSEEHVQVYTTLPYHFEYYFQPAGSRLTYLAPDSLYSEMRRGVRPLQSFWLADAHGRTFHMQPVDSAFIWSHFENKAGSELFDAWTKLFVPRRDSLQQQ